MARHIKVGIDIGTYQVKVAVIESVIDKGRQVPRVLGVGFSESKGMRHGYIINPADITRSVSAAVLQAEKASGIRIKKAYVSMGGMGLESVVAHGSTVISRADSEVSNLDMEKAIRASELAVPKTAFANRKLLHTIPIEFRVDGSKVLGRPQGIKGSRLEVKTLFVTGLDHHIRDTVSALNEAGIDVEDMIAAPFAASLVTLTKVQKMAGCVLANIGAETVSIVVYENDLPTSLEVFEIGSNDITNDIALGLKIPLEEAEDIKIGNAGGSNYPRKKLEEIIEARLSDIFELIEAHLKKIGRAGLLPAGIIITGGGSGLESLQDFAKSSLRLPSKIASLNLNASGKTPIRDATWAVAYGLCTLGFSAGEEDAGLGGNIFSNNKKRFFDLFKSFLP